MVNLFLTLKPACSKFCDTTTCIIVSFLLLNTTFTQYASGQSSIGAPVFSVSHGFYYNPFELEITASDPSARILYTTDGSAPSVSNGNLYTGSLSIAKTSVIRAVCIRSELMQSKIATATFLFPEDIIRQPNNPDGYPSEWSPFLSINGIAPGDYEMDPEMMSDPMFAEEVVDALTDLPVISLVTDRGYLFSKNVDQYSGGIYIHTGTANGVGYGWERPVSFEFFSAKDTGSFQVDCGIQIQGGEGRRPEKSPKHSFRLVFKDEYGPSKLNYPFFGDDAISEFNSVILRAGFGNTWIHHSSAERIRAQYIRDRWTKDTQRAMGHYSSHGIYVHLFLNGLYWGIYNPSERLDREFAESYLSGEEEDYDVIKDYSEAVDGEITSWNRLMTLANSGLKGNDAYQIVRGNNPDGTPDHNVKPLLDVVSLADYMLLNFFGGNTDWDHHNWVAIRNRIASPQGFQFFCWDAEHMVESINANILDENNDRCPSRIFQQLRQNQDFRRLFANRVQKFCLNNGALTPASTAERWVKRASEIEKAVKAESARWGDYRRDVHQYQTAGPFDLYSPDSHWLPQLDFMLNTYFPERTEIFISQLKKANLFPDLDAPVFFLNGQPVSDNSADPGDKLTMTSGKGTIWYTVDGSDPAVFGQVASVSSEAKLYTVPVLISRSAHIKARVIYNGEFSAVNEQMFVIPADFKDLKITEIHYHPVNENNIKDSVFEFIELKNTGLSTLYLEGLQFIKGIRYRFPAETYLKPGEFLVLSSNSRYFAQRYHFRPFDQYNGHLANEGEEIVLTGTEKDTICAVWYDDENGWPHAADGDGKSIVPLEINPSDNQKLPEYWRHSYASGGSPGADDIYRSEKWTSELITSFQNYPNPFSEKTIFSYNLYIEAEVSITIFDISGKPVMTLEDARKASGSYSLDWNCIDHANRRVPPGIYFCRIEAKSAEIMYSETLKMVII